MATNPTIKPRRGTSAPGAGAITQNELAVDTTNKRIYIGAADGSGTLIGSAPGGSSTQVQFNDGGNLGGSSGLIFSKTSFDLTIGGDLAVSGGDITTTVTTFNLLNTTVTNANVLGAADTIVIGSANNSTTIRNAITAINGALTVTGNGTFVANILANGGTITSTATTFNLLNTTVTGLNIGGAANTVILGGAGGTATIRNAGTSLNGTLTVTGVSVHQGAGSFNSTLTVTGATTLNNNLTVTGASTLQGNVNMNGTLTVTGATTLQGAMSVSTTISSGSTTFNLLNTTVTNANVFGAANTVVIGGTGGTATVRNAGTNINGTLTVTGATTLQGASTLQGNVNMNGTLTVTGVSNFVGVLTANTITTTSFLAATVGGDEGGEILLGKAVTNTTLSGTGVTIDVYQNRLRFFEQGGAARGYYLDISNGGGGASTQIGGSATAAGSNTQVQYNNGGAFAGSGNFTFDGSGVNVNGIISSGLGISTSATTFNIATNTASTINIGTTSGSAINIGNAGGTTTIRNAGTNINGTLTVTGVSVHQGAGAFNSTLSVTGASTLIGDVTAGGDIAVNGGDITSTATTFNLLNATVTNANVLGAANTVVLGGTGGTTTIRNAGTNINGTLTVTGVSVHQGAGAFNSTLSVTGVTTLQGASTLQGAVNMNSTLTVTGVSVHQGAGAFNSTLSVTGTSTLIGDVTASGDIAVNGGDITSTATTFNLLNATVTGLNIGGAANRVVLGNTGGTATIRNAGTNINGTLTVTGATTLQSTLDIGGNAISSGSTTFYLLDTTVTNLSIGGSATYVSIGAAFLPGQTIIQNETFSVKSSNISLFNDSVTGVYASSKAGTFWTFTVGEGNVFLIEPSAFAYDKPDLAFGGMTSTFIGDYSGNGNGTLIGVLDGTQTINFTGNLAGTSGSLGIYSHLILGTNSYELRFYDADGSHFVGFKAPSTVTADNTWVLPAQDGSAGQLLTTDGADNLTWTSPPALDLFLFSQGII